MNIAVIVFVVSSIGVGASIAYLMSMSSRITNISPTIVFGIGLVFLTIATYISFHR